MISDHLCLIKNDHISFSHIAAPIDLLRFDKLFYSACKEEENVIMSKTVESVYKFHGDTNVHDSPNMERGTEVNRIQKPSKLRIIAFKICKPVQNFGETCKTAISPRSERILETSQSWLADTAQTWDYAN